MNENSLINNSDLTVEGFYEFKSKVLDKPGEMDSISNKLTDTIQSEDYLEVLDFFFSHYFPEKYGKEAANFLFNLLANTKETMKKLIEAKILDKIDKIELDLLAFKHNKLISKISSQFEHPYSLMSTSGTTNGEGEYLLFFKRVDGTSFNLFLDNSQSYRLINNIIEITLDDSELGNADEEIVRRFLSVSKKAIAAFEKKSDE
ncbi:hypothetical protein ABW02_06890 [Niallia circulans]|uniref:Uncharacterized protein n=1 Tax=Niallia circulans TaxID=1397 RepID=A0A0J1LEA5_NIACI|nr:hypothetical protein [Niallia circulans]KLV27240.1 hypothetical protein ABW02_06890 [Niallia circulans]